MENKKFHSYYTVKFKAYQPYHEYEETEGKSDIKFIETEISFKEDLEGALSLVKALLDEPYKSAEIIYTYE